jgi:hypothetical protein
MFAGNFFSRATDTHIQLAQRVYISSEGKTISLLAVLHVASAEFYDAINKKLGDAKVVLYESCNGPLALVQLIDNELRKLLNVEEYGIYRLAEEFEATSHGVVLKGFPAMAGVLKLQAQSDAVHYVRQDLPTSPIFIHADKVEPGFKTTLMTLLNALRGDKKSEMAQLFLQTKLDLIQKMCNERAVGIDFNDRGKLFQKLSLFKEQDIDKKAAEFAALGERRQTLIKSLTAITPEDTLVARNAIIKQKIEDHLLFDPDVDNAAVLYGARHFEGESGIEAFVLSRGFTLAHEEWHDVLPLDAAH